MNKNKTGFTLIEILVAIAIASILAATIMVSMSGSGEKARTARALAQASSLIPAMESCWGNGGNVSSSGQLCSLGAGYGSVPSLPEGYAYNGIPSTQNTTWYFKVTGTGGTTPICCNSRMSSCGQPATCNATVNW
jgi:prepilin-type N-terminal cleavage/methylation domain-containing protein